MSVLFGNPLDSGAITVDEFEEMDLPKTCGWELIDGTVVSRPFPDLDHVDIQHTLRALLANIFGRAGVVRVEYPYALRLHTRSCADVALVDPSVIAPIVTV
jgi:hypothetical protein